MRRRRRRAAGAAATLALAALAIAVWQPPWAYRVLARAMPGIVWTVEGAGPRIALTFDDGPSPDHTPAVLDILRRHRARATFFLIGARAAAHPALVARIRAEGHEVANHYSRKGTTVFEDEAVFVEEVRRTESILAPLSPVKLFRPPGGLIRPAHREALDRLGYRTVLGSAYPYDGNGPPAAYIRWLIVKNLRPGAIVILHDGVADPANTIAALGPILDAAHAKGLAVAPVGELLAARDDATTPPSRNGWRYGLRLRSRAGSSSFRTSRTLSTPLLTLPAASSTRPSSFRFGSLVSSPVAFFTRPLILSPVPLSISVILPLRPFRGLRIEQQCPCQSRGRSTSPGSAPTPTTRS